jgi:hypothetical protein
VVSTVGASEGSWADVPEVTPMMTSMMLLFSLLTPNHLEQYANELLVPEQTEPRCDELERMLAKVDAEYRVELAAGQAENFGD